MSQLLGIDLGASSIKASLLDSASDEIISARQSIPTTCSHQGWVEQNPLDWIDALQKLLSQMVMDSRVKTKDHLRPEAIAISAGAHIPVLLDDSLQPLRPAILWSDQRSAAQAQWLKQEYGDYIQQTCLNTPSATWTLSMLLWLQQHQPEITERIRQVVFAKDYIKYLLTGVLTTDPGDAVGSMLCDQRQQCWDSKLLRLCRLDLGQLPEIHPSTAIIGTTSAQVEKSFALARDTPVINGSIDTSTELLGAGAINKGDRVIKLASAGVFSWISDEFEYRARVSCYPHLQTEYCYYATGTNSCMTSVDWFAKNIAGMADFDLVRFDQLVADSHSDNLPIFHPYLQGERAPLWNPRVKASFSLLNINHRLADMAKAIYLGICFSIRHLIEQSGHKDTETTIRVIGGGARSEQLCTMLATVLQQSFITCERNDASAGSAILAGLATGILKWDDLDGGKTRQWQQDHNQYQEQWLQYQALAEFSNSIQDRQSL